MPETSHIRSFRCVQCVKKYNGGGMKTKEFLHRTKDGKTIRLTDIDDGHLINIINMHRRLAKAGITIRSGGGCCAEDIWYDEDTVFGKEALSYLKHDIYLAEAIARKLTV